MDAQVYFFNYCNQMDLNQSSMAACATNIHSYFSMSYIAGVCEVYALWYEFFLKLLYS